MQNSEGDDRRIGGIWCLDIERKAELERLCMIQAVRILTFREEIPARVSAVHR